MSGPLGYIVVAGDSVERYYPQWSPDIDYKEDDLVVYKKVFYKARWCRDVHHMEKILVFIPIEEDDE